MNETYMCDGCPNRGTVKCGLMGRPFDDETGYAALADSQGGMTDIIDLNRAEFPSQVTANALVNRVKECDGPEEVVQEKGRVTRLLEKLHIYVLPEQVCPALGSLAVSDMSEIPPSSIRQIREDTAKLSFVGAFMRGLDEANKARGH